MKNYYQMRNGSVVTPVDNDGWILMLNRQQKNGTVGESSWLAGEKHCLATCQNKSPLDWRGSLHGACFDVMAEFSTPLLDAFESGQAVRLRDLSDAERAVLEHWWDGHGGSRFASANSVRGTISMLHRSFSDMLGLENYNPWIISNNPRPRSIYSPKKTTTEEATAKEEDQVKKTGTPIAPKVALVFATGADAAAAIEKFVSKDQYQMDQLGWWRRIPEPLIVYFERGREIEYDRGEADVHSGALDSLLLPGSWLTESTAALLPNAVKPLESIDYGWLKERSACPEGAKWFCETFGPKARPKLEVVRGLLKSQGHGDWLDWLDAKIKKG